MSKFDFIIPDGLGWDNEMVLPVKPSLVYRNGLLANPTGLSPEYTWKDGVLTLHSVEQMDTWILHFARLDMTIWINITRYNGPTSTSSYNWLMESEIA